MYVFYFNRSTSTLFVNGYIHRFFRGFEMFFDDSKKRYQKRYISHCQPAFCCKQLSYPAGRRAPGIRIPFLGVVTPCPEYRSRSGGTPPLCILRLFLGKPAAFHVCHPEKNKSIRNWILLTKLKGSRTPCFSDKQSGHVCLLSARCVTNAPSMLSVLTKLNYNSYPNPCAERVFSQAGENDW